MDYPWVFREARGENNGVQCIRRHLMGYFGSLPGGIDLRNTLNQTGGLNDCLAALDQTQPQLAVAS